MVYQGFTQCNQDSQNMCEKRMGRVMAYPPQIQYNSYGANEKPFYGSKVPQN